MTDVAITAITSTVGSGASVSTFSRKVTTPWRSPVKMTRRTTPGHVRLEEILNNNKHGGLKRPYLMIRRKSKTGGPTRAQSSRWRAGVECASARTCCFVGSLGAICSVFSYDAADEHSHSLWRTSGEQRARPLVGLVERGSTTPVAASSTLGKY